MLEEELAVTRARIEEQRLQEIAAEEARQAAFEERKQVLCAPAPPPCPYVCVGRWEHGVSLDAVFESCVY
jgi:hypothetical protein